MVTMTEAAAYKDDTYHYECLALSDAGSKGAAAAFAAGAPALAAAPAFGAAKSIQIHVNPSKSTQIHENQLKPLKYNQTNERLYKSIKINENPSIQASRHRVREVGGRGGSL